MDCIFCKIVNKEIPKDFVYEDEEIVAFNDSNPIAPLHMLIIPKKHIESVNDLGEADKDIVGKMILIARDIAKEKGIAENGYKLLIRTGKDGGQEVPHIHLHLMGGTMLYEEIRPI